MGPQIWNDTWRESQWSSLDRNWDAIIIGGGITGAGILREAARAGLQVVLIEAGDFASGTSSRSSKLVHGGFRYLKNAQLKLTLESVHERERLLKEGRGLITQLGFLLASYRGDSLPIWMFGLGLGVYDIIALKWQHRYYDAYDIHELCPPLRTERLVGGYRFFDAQTDDARLVLRILREAVRAGGVALNYTRAIQLLRGTAGRVCGVVIQDRAQEGSGKTLELHAKVVINATGAWADDLRGFIGETPRLRKLRGSHLVFPYGHLPLSRAVSFLHPADRRPVFAIPWEGVTIFGTTDFDHPAVLETDISIDLVEAEYLLTALQQTFPSLNLGWDSIQATFSGVRPVLNTGKSNPSKESREHILWNEQGLLTITGGKLTTFRLMALDVVRRIVRDLQPSRRVLSGARMLDDIQFGDALADLPAAVALRLAGRYGIDALEMVQELPPGEFAPIHSLPAQWAELRWAARAEAVIHLDDLLLRRVRLGLVLPSGGLHDMERIRAITQPELNWDAARWNQEVSAYHDIWQRCYAPPHFQSEWSLA